MKVVTRFAPSPTGTLHLGSARTALFNYLFAKHYEGKFLLRIEDTDKERSKDHHTSQILEALNWLNIEADDEIVYQSKRIKRHQEVAKQLVNSGAAYYCYYSQDQLHAEKEEAIKSGKHYVFRSPWRDVDLSNYPKHKLPAENPVIRLKAPESEELIIEDLVQGKVSVNSEEIDDLVLLRSDGSPTYMLAVVVDDHDMDVTHIIRGDDHLNNTFKQALIYRALDIEMPDIAHIPLIHNNNGEKLSKREGASDVLQYKQKGYLSEAMSNYLLRLGWAHGDEEIIDRDRAIKLFGSHGLGKSPAKIDFSKLDFLNAHYIHNLEDKDFIDRLKPFITSALENYEGLEFSKEFESNFEKAATSIKKRATTLMEAAELSIIYHPEFIPSPAEDAKEVLSQFDQDILTRAKKLISAIENFDKDNIESTLKTFAKDEGLKVGMLMKPLRVITTGMINSPSVFELIAILGRDKSLERISHYV